MKFFNNVVLFALQVPRSFNIAIAVIYHQQINDKYEPCAAFCHKNSQSRTSDEDKLSVVYESCFFKHFYKQHGRFTQRFTFDNHLWKSGYTGKLLTSGATRTAIYYIRVKVTLSNWQLTQLNYNRISIALNILKNCEMYLHDVDCTFNIYVVFDKSQFQDWLRTAPL